MKCRILVKDLFPEVIVKDLNKHIVNHNNRKKSSLIKHQCGKCDKIYMSRSTLGKHVMSKHPELLYQCHFCGEKYKNEKLIKEHLFKFHI